MRKIKLAAFGIIVSLTEDGGGSITSSLHEAGATKYNAAMDGLESMILAHAIAGINIESLSYLEGIETAVVGCAGGIDEDEIPVEIPVESVKKLVEYINNDGDEAEHYETYAEEQGIDDQTENPENMDEDHIYTHIRRVEEAL